MVSFSPAQHPADSLDAYDSPKESSPGILLSRACPGQWKKSDEILQSSFEPVEHSIIPRGNGFVGTVVAAYSGHQALIIRPDDVWLAILTQFNFFVNGNAELLRSQFVSHEGTKKLVVTAAGSRYTVDFGDMACRMTEQMRENIVDPTLCEWILPDFSTTTVTDTTVGAVVMMATLKAYFAYSCVVYCGLPRVTLEGEKSDWEKILGRLEKLKEYGMHTTAWYHLLVPVISRFVKAFDDPNCEANLDFWQRVVHFIGGGSGSPTLSGWISAFCVFGEQGQWLGHPLNASLDASINLSSLPAQEFWSTVSSTTPLSHEDEDEDELTLDGTRYHMIDSDLVPRGYAEVDVDLDDNGTHFDTTMTAGQVGSRVSSSNDKELSDTGKNDTMRPLAGWWIFTVRDKSKDEL